MLRSTARTALTLSTSLLLLALTALPALASEAATKPTPGEDDFLIGSMPQLWTAMIVGLVLGAIVFAVRPKGPSDDDDHH